MKLQRYEQKHLANANRSQRANMYGGRQIGNVYQTVADTRTADLASTAAGLSDVVLDLQLKAQKKIDDGAARKSTMNANLELQSFQPSLDNDKADKQIKQIMKRMEDYDGSLEGRSVDMDETFKQNRDFAKAKLEKMQVFGRIKIADQQETAEFKTNMDLAMEQGDAETSIGYAQSLRDKGVNVPYTDKQITSRSLANKDINSLDGMSAIQIKGRLEWLQDGKFLAPSGKSEEYDKKNNSRLIKGMHRDELEVVKAAMKKKHTELQLIGQDRLFEEMGKGEIIEDKELEEMVQNGDISRKVAKSVRKFKQDKAIAKDMKKIFEIEWALMDEDQWSPNPIKRKEQYLKFRNDLLTLNASDSRKLGLAQTTKRSFDAANKGISSQDQEKRKQVLKFGKDMIGSLHKKSEAFQIYDPWFSSDPDADGNYAHIRSLNAISDFTKYVEEENPNLQEAMEWMRINSAQWKKVIGIHEMKSNFISNPMNGKRAK